MHTGTSSESTPLLPPIGEGQRLPDDDIGIRDNGNGDSGIDKDKDNDKEPPTPLRSHDRSDSILPEFIFASIETVSEAVHEVTEHIEELAHDLVTYEPLDIDELLASAGMESGRDFSREHGDDEAETGAGKLRDEDDASSAFRSALEIDEGEPGVGPGTAGRGRSYSLMSIRNESESVLPDDPVIQELIHPTDPMDPFHSPNHEKLGVVPLAVMVFYSVSGGPFGCETSVRSAGNFYALVGFLVMPLVWSVQEALMTAELGTAFQEASGGVAWVEEAFGSNAGWISGYLGWLAGATDNAIYPVLFLDYLLQAMHSDGDALNPVLRFFLLALTSCMLGYVNWLGLPLVGRMSVSICLIAMSPFILLMIIGVWKTDTSRWFELPNDDIKTVVDATDDDVGGGFFPNAALGGVLWRPFLNNLFWNLNSFDAAGSFAADIDDPARVLPRAMLVSVIMVSSCYFLPLLVAIGASDARQEDWVDGYLARVTGDVAGPWLGAWTVFAAGISNIALFQAELSADAFQLMGMADRGHLPKIFSHRSRHNTPTFGILLGTAVIVVMGASNLDTLIEMLNFNYSISLLMEYSAFLKLRISRPDLERPYRIPLNTFGCIILFLPTFVATFAILVLATYTTLSFSLGVNIFGMLIFYGKQRSEHMRLAQEEYEGDQVATGTGRTVPEKYDAASVEGTTAESSVT